MTDVGAVLKHLEDTLVVTITRRRRRVVIANEYHKISGGDGGEQQYGYVQGEVIEDQELQVMRQEIQVDDRASLTMLTRAVIAVLNGLET
jgi:hypothetical protein